MNAISIIESVRKNGGSIVLDDEGRLKVRGVGKSGETLPEELRKALSEHKAELMIALGCAIQPTLAQILEELRPQLPPSLQRLADDKLLALMEWSIIHTWEQSIQKLGRGGR